MTKFGPQFDYLLRRFAPPPRLALGAPAAGATPLAQSDAHPRRRSLLTHPSMGALLIALGAVVGARFLAANEGRVASSVPTIAAPSEATKLKVAQGGTPSAASGRSATPAAGPAAAPVQAQAPAPAAGLAGVATNSYFPEPKRVKSVTTDARGRIIDTTPTGSIAVDKAALASVPAAPAPAVAAVAVELPPPAPVNVSVVARAQPPVVSPQAAAPAVDQRAPANVVDSARFGRPGSVSVQLAAAGSEEEARALAERLQQRFATEFDGRSLAIIEARPRDRTVYRLRLTELSRDEAESMCAMLRASRAGCFVARD